MLAAKRIQSKTSEANSKRPAPTPDGQGVWQSNPTWQALALRPFRVQPKLTVSQPDDPYEREADRIADRIMRTAVPGGTDTPLKASPSVSTIHRKCNYCDGEKERIQRKSKYHSSSRRRTAKDVVNEALNSSGQPLDSATREFMEPRFGSDLSHVRIHTGASARESAAQVNARAYTVGSDIVFGPNQYQMGSNSGKRLLAHELTHVFQQGHARPLDLVSQSAFWSGVTGPQRGKPADALSSAAPSYRTAPPLLQRTVMLTTPGTGRHAMLPPERRSFISAHIAATHRPLASRVLEDMAAAGDEFDFADERELELDLQKRVATSEIMQETQIGAGRTAFGYPFNPPADLYGPRVNYAARAYWVPLPPDGYVDRSRSPRAATARRTPRGLRHIVFGDMSDYEWSLTPAGLGDFYQALRNLFVPQPQVYKRSLLHCDYLVSLVHFRALATAIGSARFNAAARAYGADNLRLRWNLYSALYADNFSGFNWWASTLGNPSRAAAAALGSLARVRPSSIADLVIGDHVVFSNHKAYDPLNENIGNAWRLENAILIDRRRGSDLFLGHGSGIKTDLQMRQKLAQEYNEVADIALGIVGRIAHGSSTAQAAARAELTRRFPKVEEDGGRWWIREGGIWGLFRTVNQPLRRITAAEVPGLHDPNDPTRMHLVQRPHESRP